MSAKGPHYLNIYIYMYIYMYIYIYIYIFLSLSLSLWYIPPPPQRSTSAGFQSLDLLISGSAGGFQIPDLQARSFQRFQISRFAGPRFPDVQICKTYVSRFQISGNLESGNLESGNIGRGNLESGIRRSCKSGIWKLWNPDFRCPDLHNLDFQISRFARPMFPDSRFLEIWNPET